MSDDSTISGSDFSEAASASSTEAASTATEESSAAPVTTESSADPAATVQADATATTAPLTTDKPKGPIPFEVHHTALENARTKAKDEALAEWRKTHGWAEQVNRAEIEALAPMAQLYQRDRPAFVRQILSEGVADPEVAALIRSEAARFLGSRAPAQESTEIEPDIPVMDESGRVVNHAYSATAVKQLVQRAVEEAIGKKVAPLEQDYQARQKHAERAAYNKRLDDAVKADERFVESRPYWKDHKAAIQKLYAETPSFVTLRDAYYHYVEHTLLPNLSKTERTKVVNGLTEKVAASSVSPSSGTTALPIPDDQKSWEELLREGAAQMGL